MTIKPAVNIPGDILMEPEETAFPKFSERSWNIIIIVTSATILFLTFLCLLFGITTVFMHLYYFPIILLAYHYQKKGVLYSVILSLLYFVMVLWFRHSQYFEIFGALLRVLSFIGIAVVVACLSIIISQKQQKILTVSQFNKTIVSNINVWLAVLDAKGDILVWNRAAENISGYNSEEVIGKNSIWKDLYPDNKYRKNVTKTITKNLREKKLFENFETIIVTKNGGKRTISWNSCAIPNEQSVYNHFVATGIDITERKKAQNDLQRLNDQLEEKVKTRTAELEEANLKLTDQNLTLKIMNTSTLALIAAEDVAGFIQEICNKLVRTGWYSQVWLTGIENDKKIGFIADTCDDEYPKFSGMLAEGRLPPCAEQVYKAGGFQMITHNPDCSGCPLSGLHEDNCTIVVRLDAGEKIVGILGITLMPGVSSTEQETERIRHIAHDIAFGILYLRTKSLEQAASAQISKNLEQLAILNDHIRNPLQGIVGYAGMNEGEPFTKIIELSMEIDSIVAKLDQGYLESKKIRDFIELHENVAYKPDLMSDTPKK